jgi:hypothetical protein
VLLLSFISFGFDFLNMKEIDAQQQLQQYPPQQQLQQYPQQPSQIQWQTYTDPVTKISIQFPIDWQVAEDNSPDLAIHSPETSFYIGVENFVFSSGSLETARQKAISMNMQKGFSLTSSQILENQFGPYVFNKYSDNINRGKILIEILKEGSYDSFWRYRTYGDPIQYQKYEPIALKIFQTAKINPGSLNTPSNAYGSSSQWESDATKKIINENNQIVQDTYDIATKSFQGMADSFADSAKSWNNYLDKKQCQKDYRNLAC